MTERFVVAGLARARTDWFTRVGRWATEGAIAVDFVRCVSVAELRTRLETGRRFSAVLVADDVAGLDRDLLALAREAGAAPIVVGAGAPGPWHRLGAAAVLPPDLGRSELLDVLGQVAAPVAERVAAHADASAPLPRGRLVAVTGPGGTGVSTASIALAQGLAELERGTVLLADLRRAAEQAMLHDAQTVVPGLQELVEAHRNGVLDHDAVLAGTFDVPARGYRLLLGLRRSRQWTTLRPRALATALRSLQQSVDVTVADVDPDVEGEAWTGSTDVEERHLASRLALTRADAVVVVGDASTKGLYSLARLLDELLAFGVPPRRLVPVCNRVPRSARHRSELTRALAGLLTGVAGGDDVASPVHLPERRVDLALRDGVGVPAPLPALLRGPVAPLLDRPRVDDDGVGATPVPVVPGALGLVRSGDDEEDVA